MTLINPFGISRYLQPRRAGMIAFKEVVGLQGQ